MNSIDRESSFVAIDWGTSNFRLWHISTDGTVLIEHRDNKGMQALSNDEYKPFLTSIFSELKIAQHTPTIICGMAGAAKGWYEAPYIDTPTSFDVIAQKAIRVPIDVFNTYILPGLAQRSEISPDVMRGEETQLLGLMSDPLYKKISQKDGQILVCIPGTHSKWITLEKHKVIHFSTYMTGELFSLLSTQSTLSHILGSQKIQSGDISSDNQVFSKAVEEAIKSQGIIINELFSIRSKQLLFPYINKTDGLLRLLGLLIGGEIASVSSLIKKPNTQVILASEGGSSISYSKAFDVANIDYQITNSSKLTLDGLIFSARIIWPTLFAKQK